VYEEQEGWSEPLGECRRFGDLPKAAQAYVQRVSARLEVPVRMIGVGPARDQVILVDGH